MKKTLIIIIAVALLGMTAATFASSEEDMSVQSAKKTSTQTTVNEDGIRQTTIDAVSSTSQATNTSQTGSYKDGTYQGVDASNRYGDIQVSITVSGGKIVGVTFDQLNSDDRHSEQINELAAPDLKSQTLAAQGSKIDGVSGATITTESYIESLESALDKAKS